MRGGLRGGSMPFTSKELPAAMCPITQEIMEDPVICADGHSYERSAITQWLLVRDTSPCTNTTLSHRNVVPNYALRNLIAEVRGVRRYARTCDACVRATRTAYVRAMVDATLALACRSPRANAWLASPATSPSSRAASSSTSPHAQHPASLAAGG